MFIKQCKIIYFQNKHIRRYTCNILLILKEILWKSRVIKYLIKLKEQNKCNLHFNFKIKLNLCQFIKYNYDKLTLWLPCYNDINNYN